MMTMVFFRVRPAADRPGLAAAPARADLSDPATADQIVDQAAFAPGELVVEIGAGSGALTRALARRPLRVIAVEPDPVWARRLREQTARSTPGVQVVAWDFRAVTLPRDPFRVIGSPPFAGTTDILRRLLDDPAIPMRRADVIVQWEVAVKRAAIRRFCLSRWRVPMQTSLSASGRSSRFAIAPASDPRRKSWRERSQA
jgi:23S rRNA (adenine-N6)-dimethyltransferase